MKKVNYLNTSSLNKLNGAISTSISSDGGRYYWGCQYDSRDAEMCKDEKSALLKMANMLKEDANRIEEFVKSIQNESTNQG